MAERYPRDSALVVSHAQSVSSALLLLLLMLIRRGHCLVRGEIDSLTGLTSFGHLLNIEFLDLSRNQIDSLRRESRPYLCNTCAAQT